MDSSFTHFKEWLYRNRIVPTREEATVLHENTSRVTIAKNTLIMEQGRPVRNFYFLNSGVARLYLKYDDTDLTIAFIQAPQFVSTLTYLLNQHQSALALETCTDVEGLRWSREQYLAIKENTGFVNAWELAFAAVLLEWNLERELDRLTLSAGERYEKLLRNCPLVIQTVPVKYIASYLGIHQDSLSRIRNRLMKKF